MDLNRIEEAFDDASLSEFDIDPDAELFDPSFDDLDDVDGGCAHSVHLAC